MNIAYIRVSTDIQSYEGQQFEIRNWCANRNLEISHWIEETASGASPLEKRQLGRLLKRMKRGDALVCTELSRLGRNMMMVMAILNTCSQRGICLYSIKDHFELSESINSKIIAFAFSLAAEIERNLISIRTREALAAKRSSGVQLGRPKGSSRKRRQFQESEAEIRRKLADGTSIGQLAIELKVHRNTLSRYLKDR